MIDRVLGADRLIGLVQPEDTTEESPQGKVPLSRIGCLGRITHFEESGDERYLIILDGITRFELGDELTVMTPYRQFKISAERFASDFERGYGVDGVNRDRFLKMMRDYAEFANLEPRLGRDRQAPAPPSSSTSAAWSRPMAPPKSSSSSRPPRSRTAPKP